MAKKNFSKGIDRVFSPTVEASQSTPEPEPVSKIKKAPESKGDVVNYNLQYPKELQKRIKLFCIENDGIDMRNVFIQGANMYLEKYAK